MIINLTANRPHDGDSYSQRRFGDHQNNDDDSIEGSTDPSHPGGEQETGITSSSLGQIAHILATWPTYNLASNLAWQRTLRRTTLAQARQFKNEVTQDLDLVAFAFMRPGSPIIQVIHSIATFTARGGDADLHNKDFGFLGDRTPLRTPAPVSVKEKLWKWVTKKAVIDSGTIEEFYANPTNARERFHSTTDTERVIVPQLLHLPPFCIEFCVKTARTPFELHQHVTHHATQIAEDIPFEEFYLLREWCLVASNRASASSDSSMLACSLQPAHADNDKFVRWMHRRVKGTIDTPLAETAPHAPLTPPQAHGTQGILHGTQGILPATQIPRTLPQAFTQFALPAAVPQPDMWAQLTASLSHSFAQAATSFTNTSREPSSGAHYEEGGRNYDEFQLAVLRGFAHTSDMAQVPTIWSMFQHTKHMDTHKDNIRRCMNRWATTVDPSKPYHVDIERSIHFPLSTLREILSLKFNLGGPTV